MAAALGPELELEPEPEPVRVHEQEPKRGLGPDLLPSLLPFASQPESTPGGWGQAHWLNDDCACACVQLQFDWIPVTQPLCSFFPCAPAVNDESPASGS